LRNATKLLEACKRGGAQAIVAGHVHERFDHPATAGRPRVLCVGSSTDNEGDGPGAYALEIADAQLVGVQTIALA